MSDIEFLLCLLMIFFPLFAAIFSAISATRPRADVAYCIHALARRLSKTHNWAVGASSFSNYCTFELVNVLVFIETKKAI